MKKKIIGLIALLFFIITPINSTISDQHTEEIPTEEIPTGSQMETEKKPAIPDLEVLKKHTRVYMINKKEGCEFQAQSKVKNVGGKDADQSTLRFKKANKEYATFKIEKSAGLKAGKSSFGKDHPKKGKEKIAKGNYTWTFSVDQVSGETNTANNTISFDCNCPSKKKTCKKK